MTRKSCAVGMRNAILRNYLNYKILLMTYKAIHGLSPDCIQSLVHVKKKSLYNLRSNDEVLLAPPTFKSNKTTGDRAFQVAAPSEWNKLAKSLRLENDLKSFKTKLKKFISKSLLLIFFNFLTFFNIRLFYILLTTVNIIIISHNFLNIVNNLVFFFKNLRSFTYGSFAI